MIDVSGAKWDFSKEEKFAIEWLNDNGFSGKLEKQYVGKTIFTIEKNGITETFELPQGIKNMNISKYMEQFSKNWKVLCELQKLRKQVKNPTSKEGGLYGALCKQSINAECGGKTTQKGLKWIIANPN